MSRRDEDPNGSRKDSDRKQREHHFQRKQSKQEKRVSPTPTDIFNRYSRNRNWRLYPKEHMYRAMGDLKGKRVLDFGCGTGEISTQLGYLGAEVLGIDLSPELIDLARKRAEFDGLSDRVTFRVADGETADIPDEAFDFVIAYAVLHHMKLNPALNQLHQALKRDGRVFIVEPISFSGTLAWIRKCIPVSKHASPDERELDQQEIRHIARSFDQSELRFYRVVERLERVLPRNSDHQVVQDLVSALAYLFRLVDRVFLLIPGAWRFAGRILITGIRKDGPDLFDPKKKVGGECPPR